MASLMNMLPQSVSSSSQPIQRTTTIPRPLLPTASTEQQQNKSSVSIFKTVVPGGKWDAQLQIISYAAYNYCKNIIVRDIAESSIVFGFVVQEDVILEIDDIELFTLSVKQVQALIAERVHDPKTLVIQRFQRNVDIAVPLVIPSL